LPKAVPKVVPKAVTNINIAPLCGSATGKFNNKRRRQGGDRPYSTSSLNSKDCLFSFKKKPVLDSAYESAEVLWVVKLSIREQAKWGSNSIFI
jgi:hypothetical protein